MWCPELKDVPIEYIHDPWKMPVYVQKQCKVVLGQDYPHPFKCAKYLDPKNAPKRSKSQGTLDKLAGKAK